MISILFLSADPTDQTRLRLGEEAREIEEKLQLSRQRDNFDFIVRLSVRPQDISQAMLDIGPQIVHFSGHGNEEGALCVENLSGHTLAIDAEALAMLFENFAGQLNCVILNACYSAVQAKAIARYIPYVIGMSKEVGDLAALSFSIGFYQALGAGRNIEQAFKMGCALIRMQGIPEHLTPKMLKPKEATTAPPQDVPPQVVPIPPETHPSGQTTRTAPVAPAEPALTPPAQEPPRFESLQAMADLQSIFLDLFAVKSDQLSPEARFIDDLEMDSLDLIELIMAVEDKFQIEISDEEVAKITTVGEGMQYIQNKLNQS
jgi:acyl carrier protein